MLSRFCVRQFKFLQGYLRVLKKLGKYSEKFSKRWAFLSRVDTI